MDKSLLEIAFEYVGAGLSVLPVKTDETKAPPFSSGKSFNLAGLRHKRFGTFLPVT